MEIKNLGSDVRDMFSECGDQRDHMLRTSSSYSANVVESMRREDKPAERGKQHNLICNALGVKAIDDGFGSFVIA